MIGKGIHLVKSSWAVGIGKNAEDHSLGTKARSGAAWTGTFMIASHGVRLASNLILTRLLVPNLFGLMLMVNVFIMGLQMFSDVGIGPSVIQHKRGDDPNFLNTAWTVQIIRGWILGLASCALAYPAALFFDEPKLIYLLPVVGIGPVVAGFYSTSIFERERHLRVIQTATLGLCAQVIGAVVMIVWALFDRSVWALVANSIAVSITVVVMSHVIFPPATPNRLRWEKQARGELFSYGRWVFLSTVLAFFVLNFDKLVLGRLADADFLGVYSIAFFLATAVWAISRKLVKQVIFPALSRVSRDSPQRMREVYYRVRLRLDLVTLPATGFLVGAGPLIVTILYDDRYLAAGWMLQWLALRAVMSCVIESSNTLLLSIGKPKYGFLQNLIRVFAMAAFITCGWYWDKQNGGDGNRGIIIGLGVSEAAPMLFLWAVQWRKGLLLLHRELLAVVLALAGIGAGYSCVLLWDMLT